MRLNHGCVTHDRHVKDAVIKGRLVLDSGVGPLGKVRPGLPDDWRFRALHRRRHATLARLGRPIHVGKIGSRRAGFVIEQTRGSFHTPGVCQMQHALTQTVAARASAQGILELMTIWAGQTQLFAIRPTQTNL